MKNILVILHCFSVWACSGQSKIRIVNFNLDLEQQTDPSSLPDGWTVSGTGYQVSPDTLVRHGGKISIRISRSGKPFISQTGICKYSFPSVYRGKLIELRGFMKTKDVNNGSATLFINISGESGKLAYKVMKKKGLHGNRDWAEYKIVLPLPERASSISFGAILSGSGTVWIDDFSLKIDHKDISEAPLREEKRYLAEDDHDFDLGSSVDIGELSNLKIEDLAILGQVWGFLKYYHPAVARGDYHWDYELFRILPKIMAAKYPEERNIVLSAWIKGLGPVNKNRTKQSKPKDIRLNPDLAWINETNLGITLFKLLNEVKEAERKEEHYYIDIFKSGYPNFKHEKTYTLISYPDDGFMLLCLFRYWNVMQYYNPNRQHFGGNWQQVLREFIPRFTGSDTKLAYSLTTQELICRTDDVHARYDWNRSLNYFFGTNYAVPILDFIEDQLVVIGFCDSALGTKTGLAKGDVIEKVNGRAIPDIVAERMPYSKATNKVTRMRTIAENILRINDDTLKIQYRRQGVSHSSRLMTYPNGKFNLHCRYVRTDTCFKLLSPGIGYLNMGSFRNEHLEKIIPEILRTKGLIIDMRCTPADNTIYTLLPYLLSKPTPFSRFSTGSLLQPGLFTMSDDMLSGQRSREAYQGKIIILVNGITQNFAEYQAMAYSSVPGAMVIGSTTAGEVCNVSEIPLPGGFCTWISGIGVYYPDGMETLGIGIVPDLEVKPTIEGIRNGRDEVLEKAIESMKGI